MASMAGMSYSGMLEAILKAGEQRLNTQTDENKFIKSKA